MKQLIYILNLILLITSFYNGRIEAQDWSIVNISTTNTLWDVYFVNLSSGWVIGNSGLIKKTTNGGSSWFNQTSGTTESLRRIKMQDSNTGFICGHNGIILKTTNSGTNWTLTDLGTNSYYSMDLGSIHYTVGDNKNYALSNDNGVNWYTGIMNGIADNPDIYGIEKTTSSVAYVCTQAAGIDLTPRIYKTTDNGISWFVSKQLSPENFSNTDLNFIYFDFNPTKGFCAGTNGIMLRTSDAGLNWSETQLGSFDIRHILFRDSQLGYACGSGGNISVTSNSGLNWTLIPAVVTTATLQSGYSFYQFAYEFNVWCCGTNGVLIKSTNGGGSFKAPTNIQATPVSGTQIIISWQDNSLVEAGFVIYRSSNNFTYTFVDSVDENINSYLNTGLNANTLYYYKIYAVSGTAQLTSNTASAVTLLNPPSLISPLNESNNIAADPNFNWTAVSGVTSYTLQLSTDSLFSSIIYNDSTLITNSINVSNGVLDYGNTYYWRAKGKSATNYSEYSASWKFTTMTCDASPDPWVSIQNGAGNGTDYISKVITDSKGNVFTTGRTWSSITSDYDYMTSKYNVSGTLLWSKTYNGIGNYDDYGLAMDIDTAGDIIVTGLSYDNANADYLTIKYNSNGDVIWINRYNASGYWDVGTAIMADDSGNVYVTGQSYILSSSYDIVTIKYNSSGVQQWLQRYTGAGAFSDEGRDLCIDVSGNIIITGLSYISGTFDFITLKYSTGGSLLWTKTYNGNGNSDDYSNSVCTDYYGSVYITGQSTGTGSGFDYLTIKYNSEGTQQWTARYNGTGNSNDVSGTIATDISGNVFVSGYSAGVGSDYDYLTIKYNSIGAEHWTQRYNGSGNSVDVVNAMKTDQNGNVFVTGYSRTDSTASAEDIVTLKYGSDGSIIKKQTYNGIGNESDKAYSMDIDCAENIYVAGMVSNSNQDFITIKYTSSDFISQMTLNLNARIEGLYSDMASIPDTVRVFLRSGTSPYNIVDSSKGLVDNQGNCSIGFAETQDETPYFICVEHRNALETWSSAPQNFSSGIMNYDFTVSASQAYGNNLVLKGSEYCFFSGDVNKDGVVDGTDGVLIDNDAANFNSGYLATDLNGDEVIDGSDAVIADNNAANFVSAVFP